MLIRYWLLSTVCHFFVVVGRIASRVYFSWVYLSYRYRTYVCMHACMHGKNQRIHGFTDERMHGCMDEWMNGWMYELMNGCMDSWMNGCMDEWMHGCMDTCTDKKPSWLINSRLLPNKGNTVRSNQPQADQCICWLASWVYFSQFYLSWVYFQSDHEPKDAWMNEWKK